MDGQGQGSSVTAIREIRSRRAGWQKQGHTWHIVPRNYSTKVGLIDLIMEKKWVEEGKSRRKIEKSGG